MEQPPGPSDTSKTGPHSENLTIEVVYALPEEPFQITLTLPSGSTLAHVVDIIQQRGPFADLLSQNVPIGIFGEKVAPEQFSTRTLNDFDRVEFYRPLEIDPMEARRQGRLQKSRLQKGRLQKD